MTIDILICSIDKGIVRTGDLLLPQRPDVRYIISYQYTDERYLDLIPTVVEERDDVSLYKWRGRGLSANRNLAVEKATGDILMFADDDTHIIPESLDKIIRIFERDPQLDVAFFSASTYTGKPLKKYPEKEGVIQSIPESYSISTIEMVTRRASVQGKIRFDERFGQISDLRRRGNLVGRRVACAVAHALLSHQDRRDEHHAQEIHDLC